MAVPSVRAGLLLGFFSSSAQIGWSRGFAGCSTLRGEKRQPFPAVSQSGLLAFFRSFLWQERQVEGQKRMVL
jgi:hypothetical protein